MRWDLASPQRTGACVKSKAGARAHRAGFGSGTASDKHNGKGRVSAKGSFLSFELIDRLLLRIPRVEERPQACGAGREGATVIAPAARVRFWGLVVVTALARCEDSGIGARRSVGGSGLQNRSEERKRCRFGIRTGQRQRDRTCKTGVRIGSGVSLG